VILNGHDHDERFARKRPSGNVAADGIREFVVGMGGVETRSFRSTKSGSQKRITGNDNWGVLELALRPRGLPMAFHRGRFRRSARRRSVEMSHVRRTLRVRSMRSG
jgi:hypothetical protein